MKKLIRFLAQISGVEDQIRMEERNLVSSEIGQFRYWFPKNPEARNTLNCVAEAIKLGAYAWDFYHTREKILQLGGKKKDK